MSSRAIKLLVNVKMVCEPMYALTTDRVPWSEAPSGLVTAVESTLGAKVVRAETQIGGFSRGIASRLRCKGGLSAFVKAVRTNDDAFALSLYEHEAAVTQSLPKVLPAPLLLGEARVEDWFALVFEDVPGRTISVPWRRDDLQAVTQHVTQLTELATPCPVPNLMPWGGELTEWRGWNFMSAASGIPETAPAGCREHALDLAKLEAEFPDAVAGDTLLHSDLRSDNIIRDRDDTGQVTFVDWAHASRGASWIDPMIFALCVAVQGADDPEGVFLSIPHARLADPHAVNTALAALAGRFILAATTPGPIALRAFQRAESRVCASWLAQRLAW